ncbi:hypothetical protein [Micromonospora sp. NBC_01813]|uniref:hypothetical protein n=1 Tax=Micromonospora sp. NBC_01813 TaxID=2975988 RepID=UPI002DDA0994|nr:hypothetical protein [Micromonospora sp. NBC_01813]WSA07103.1 hypothetical protein OG958_22960 [Micromonospora sp. NBC_01813]
MDLTAMIENAMTSPVIYLAILDAFLPFPPSESVVMAAAVFAVSGIEYGRQRSYPIEGHTGLGEEAGGEVCLVLAGA